MLFNAIVTIKQFTGDSTHKQYGTPSSGIRALILPAGEAINALYELPVGQGYQFTILNDSILNILPESEITITDAMHSELVANQVYIVKSFTNRLKMFGQYYIKGVCISK